MVYLIYKGIVFFNGGKTSEMLSLCLTLWNNVNLVLSAFRDNLLLLNRRLIFDNSLFTVFLIIVVIYYCLGKENY